MITSISSRNKHLKNTTMENFQILGTKLGFSNNCTEGQFDSFQKYSCQWNRIYLAEIVFHRKRRRNNRTVRTNQKKVGYYGHHSSHKDTLVTRATMGILWLLRSSYQLWRSNSSYTKFEVTTKSKVAMVTIKTMEILNSHSSASLSSFIFKFKNHRDSAKNVLWL